jgi:hypothetical protein
LFKRIVPLLLAALVLPTAAAARSSELTGPVLVKGRGAVQAEVEMASPSETRALVFGGQGTLVRLVDLGGDLRVAGKCRANEAGEGERSRKVFVCNARAGRIRAHGSHFRLAARMRTWGLKLPPGATAKVRGHYAVVEPADDAGDRERPKREEPRREAPRADSPTARG